MREIYYIEDDQSIAQLVKQYLEERGFAVSIYKDSSGARQAFQDHMPEIVLLDRNLPDGDGKEFCRWLRGKDGELPIIFLTVCNDTKDIVDGFEDGADDYVTKPFELPVLYSRICALLRRSTGRQEQVLSCGNITLDQEKMIVFREGEEIMVSQSEYQILLILMKNKGRTITRQRLLEEIWDNSGNFVNDNTLTVTMKRLREKLGRPPFLKTIRSFGYRMEDSV